MRFDTPLYDYFPIQLKILSELKNQTNSSEDTVAINLLTILSCTAFIEGILFENFENVIASKRTNQVSEGNDILSELRKNFSAATFKDFNEISKKISGHRLNALTTNPTWEAIGKMFDLRNQIIHGNILSIEYTYQKEIPIPEYNDNYDLIIKFMLKKKLMEVHEINMSSIVSNKIIDFFIKVTKDFSKDVTTKLSEKFKKPTYDAFLHLNNLLRQM